MRLILALAALAGPRLSLAQDAQPPGVALQLVYDPNVRRSVLILPMNFPMGDSARAIIQRDLTFGNRLNVIRNADSLSLPARGEPDYALFEQIGIQVLVHVMPGPDGYSVSLYEVGAKKLAGSRDFTNPARPNSGEWRWSLHGMSDEIAEWITRNRGIAQTRIAFIRGGNLYAIDFDGAGERVIEHGVLKSPAWHPTQPILAFSAFFDAGWRIGAKPLSGGAVRWLTNDRVGANDAPAFAPNGSDVYYARTDDEGGNIWTMPFSVAGVHRRIMNSKSENTSPSVSPDGSRIIFVSGRLGNRALYIMDKDGSNQAVMQQVGQGIFHESPSWSPDGSSVAYAARRTRGESTQIEVMSIASRTSRRLTNAGENEDPSWGPDSKHMVFASTRTGSKQLWIMDTVTGDVRQLTHGSEASRGPAWSPRVRDEP